MALKYLLDEHISNAIADGLRRRDIVAHSIYQLGRAGKSDPEQLRFAAEHGYVVVTSDTDFLVLASKTADHGGIVFIADTRRPIGTVIQRLCSFALALSDSFTNRVEFI